MWVCERLTVEDTPLEGPSIGAPYPVGDWVVDDGSPAEDENQSGKHSTSLSSSSKQNGGYKGSKHLNISPSPHKHQMTHHLICSEYNGWDSVVGFPNRLIQDSPESDMGTISQKDTTGGRKDEAVSNEEPLERNDGERDDGEEKE